MIDNLKPRIENLEAPPAELAPAQGEEAQGGYRDGRTLMGSVMEKYDATAKGSFSIDIGTSEL